MSSTTFDFAPLLRPGLPPAAVKYTGFPPFNFVGGHNDAATTPIDGLIAAAASVLKREGATLATYGLSSGPLGYIGLRQFLSKKLHKQAGITCSTDEILITSGSNQGLDLINQVLVAPGETILMEQASYGGAISRFTRHGAKLVGVPLDKEGLRPDALEHAISDLKGKGITPKYIYTIPMCRIRPGPSWVRNAEPTSLPSRPSTAFPLSRMSATRTSCGSSRAS